MFTRKFLKEYRRTMAKVPIPGLIEVNMKYLFTLRYENALTVIS